MPTPADREPDSPPFAELLRQSRGVERRSTEAPKATTDLRTSERAEPGADPATASGETVPANDSAPKSDAGRARARAAATTPRNTARAAARPSGPTAAASRSPNAARRTTTPSIDRRFDAAPRIRIPIRPDPARPVDSELRFGYRAHRPALAATPGSDAEADAARTAATAIDSGADRDTPCAIATAPKPPAAPTPAAARRAPATAMRRRPRRSFAQTSPRRRPPPIDPPCRRGLGRAAAAARRRDRQRPSAFAGRGRHAPSPPQAATLPVAIDSPEFSAAFGVQVSVFVREGVQHAELHLNPVETGPVSIAITLEGSQAHVEFGADLAATRQAIENGLPALASALRDAGFTLAGGGVAQHSRSGSGQGEDDPAGHGRNGRRDAGGSPTVAAAAVQRASHRVAAGGIDLYA